MGATGSRGEDFATAVKPELLLSELHGEVKDDDYYARSYYLLEDFVPDESNCNLQDEDAFLSVEDSETLIKPSESIGLQHGYVIGKSGICYLAIKTDFGIHVNGKMFEWWINNCDDDEKFRYVHPRHNYSATWDPQFYSRMPHERQAGHYINHSFMVEINLDETRQNIYKKSSNNVDEDNNDNMRFHYEYIRPSKYFDIGQFARNNITFCSVSRIYFFDLSLGWVAIGYCIHVIQEKNNNSELRTRYWLGYYNYPESPENMLYARLVNLYINTPFARGYKLSDNFIKAFWLHCAEEMYCLKNFLPDYYRRCTSVDPFTGQPIENRTDDAVDNNQIFLGEI